MECFTGPEGTGDVGSGEPGPGCGGKGSGSRVGGMVMESPWDYGPIPDGDFRLRPPVTGGNGPTRLTYSAPGRKLAVRRSYHNEPCCRVFTRSRYAVHGFRDRGEPR